MPKVKKSTPKRVIPADKMQFNFNVRTSSLNKIKAIAYQEGSNSAEVLNLAVDRFIEDYEKKNGKIKPKAKGEGLKGL